MEFIDIFWLFVVRHWHMWLLLIIILVMLFYEETKSKVRGISMLSPQEMTSLINRDHAVVVDIRAANLFKKGRVVGSLNLPAEGFDTQLKRIKKYQNKPIVIVCERGQQAISVATNLHQKKQFSQVHILAGGIEAWKKAGMPLVKGAAEKSK